MAASPDRMVAGIVGDRYEITGLIASGGMGSVYRARDLVLERTVALKVLRTGDDPDFVARFRSEATNVARLNHPNIVQVYDFGYADGSPFMAMEFVDGQTLREVLNARGVLPPEVAARIAAQVGAALEAARRQGVVHRDIKPENILIASDGQVKVADFGLSVALAESRATQAGMLYGTAHYLAPEQVEGGPVDHRADLYALGVVLFEMLTGRTPFSGDSPVVIAYRRVNDDVPSILSVDADLPRALDLAVARATERDPDRRFPNAAAMAEALRDAAPRVDTEDLGALVHRTMAIPLLGHDTVAVRRPDATRSGRARRPRPLRVLLAFGLAGAIATVAITNGPLAQVTVPPVAGLSQVEAKAALQEKGFDVDTAVANDPRVPQGDVISQDPAGGAPLRKGGTVSLVISIGPELISLDTVAGKTYAVAERILRAAGFVVVREDVFDPLVPKLRVVRQRPESGVFEEGTKVTLEVSKGPELVAVPNVVGDPEEGAVADLRDKGFEVKVVREINEKVAKGLVIRQTPRPGSKIEKGEVVRLLVSLGPPLVAVPSLNCMTKRQAEDALVGRGFEVEFSGEGGRVVDQSPTPGEKAPKGSTVTAFLGLGSYC